MKKESEFILWFSDINMDSLPKVGGKAASLGEMFNIKLPIPNGFCVTTYAYEHFLEKTNIKTRISRLLKNIDVEETENLEETAQKVQDIILEQVLGIFPEMLIFQTELFGDHIYLMKTSLEIVE